MSTTTTRDATADFALAAYDSLAPFYDRFTSDSKYEPVIDAIEAWARAQGLRGNRLLDVACGTGKSFEPFLVRGYDVSACDISPPMIAEARRKTGGTVEVAVADMRALPWVDEFDLVTCLDDAINYLLTEEDLHAAIASMARAVSPDGIAVFDANTLQTYRTCFAESFTMEVGGAEFTWRGYCAPDAAPGGIGEATVTIEYGGEKHESRHIQRHWRVAELRAACLAGGFRHVVFRGLAEGPRLVGEPDEDRHPKVVCLASRPGSATRFSRARPSAARAQRHRPGCGR
jgi:SAM-dependent methyltransferase